MRRSDEEMVGVSGNGVVAVSHPEDVAPQILLDDIPRSTAESEALALTYGVEPEAAMEAEHTPGLAVDDLSGLLAQVLADVVVVVYLSEETDALTVLAAGGREVLTFCDSTHLGLRQMADGEAGFLQLPRLQLRKEVGLVLDGVRTGAKPGDFTI